MKITIDGMHCQACVRRVSAALSKLAGVHGAEVDVGSASVQFDPGKISERDIAEAVRAAGGETPAGQ
jgi:copper chaperone